MAKTTFRISSTDLPQNARPALRDAMLDARYLEKRERSGALRFRRSATEGMAQGSGGHEVTIEVAPAAGGSQAEVTLKTELGTTAGVAAALRQHLEVMLSRVLHPNAVLVEGVVAPNADRVELSRPVPGIDFEPTRNLTVEGRGAEGYGSIGFGVFLLLVGIGGLLWYPSAAPAERPGTAFIGLSAPLLGAGILAYGVSTFKSPGHPRTVGISPEGLRFEYVRRAPFQLNWPQVEGVRRRRNEINGWNILWKGSSSAPTKKLRTIKVTQHIAAEVDTMRKFALNAGEAGKRPVFDAFNFTPPGTRVIVSDRLLKPAEMKYRKLGRRFLPRGPVSFVYVTLEEDEKIVRDYVKAHPPADLEGWRLFALAAASSEFWLLAAEILRQAQGISPADVGVAIDLSGCLLRAERLDEARTAAEAFERANVPVSAIEEILAAVARKQKRAEDARRHISKAVELDPNNIGAIDLWLDIIAEQADPGQALAEIDYVSTQLPGAWAPHLAVGSRLYAGGEKDAGRTRIEKAFAIECNSDTLHAMASVHIGEGRPQEAVRIIEDAQKRGPVGPPAFLDLVAALSRTGQTTRALGLLDEVIPDLQPPFRETAFELRKRLAQNA